MWRNAPSAYGPQKTLYNRFVRWSRIGVFDRIFATPTALDAGLLRVLERGEDGTWHVNQWAKRAVLLGFRLKAIAPQAGGPQGGTWWDKVDSKFARWGEEEWCEAGFRAVPNCIVRRSAYIAPGVVLMPSFVNLYCAVLLRWVDAQIRSKTGITSCSATEVSGRPLLTAARAHR